MKYMLLIYTNESDWADGERERCMADSTKLCHELATKGQFRAASPLHSVAVATSVRIRDDKRIVTDGPFAETTEQLGGYYVIDVDDLDQAIAIASRIPGARKGTIEIRPLLELPGMPET